MKILTNCKEVSELLSQAQDRPLGLGEKFGLNLHLMMCNGCRNFGKQLDFIRAAMKRYLERGVSGR
ncbi:MAG: zf-HC2 domain-containing protein [Burkholderiales bacterium]|nr:zf-HC2 domain-containing protein [Burkholderiales bacterium]